jgi:hypothetical protein
VKLVERNAGDFSVKVFGGLMSNSHVLTTKRCRSVSQRTPEGIRVE